MSMLSFFFERKFRSTLPTRGSDLSMTREEQKYIISIHAPHEGERLVSECKRVVDQIISIHAPHEGERHLVTSAITLKIGFRSTLPTRGSDLFFVPHGCRRAISIHAPHEGERRALHLTDWHTSTFRSTLPTRGSDGAGWSIPGAPETFRSTLPTRGSDKWRLATRWK